MNTFFKLFLVSIIAVCVILSGWYLFNGSIVFHTDIARDFLLIEDIVKNKPLTLIGPRSGGIPGVFHGPLWLYVNVPAFLLGQGNPITVGWFWLILSLVNLCVIYFVSLNLFKDKTTALLAVALVAVSTLLDIRSLYNPWGAVMLSPIFFLLFWKFLEKFEFKYLIYSLFVLGLIVQFQMAFGVPLIILSFVLVFFIALRIKKFNLFFAFLILLIPLSTFILFDIKHEFLQTKAVLDFISGKENFGKVEGNFLDLFDDRIRRLFFDVPYFLTKGKWFIFIPFLSLLIFSIQGINKIKNNQEKNTYGLFLYFYLGFWFLTLFFRGQIWGYYYWPFLSLMAIFFTSLYRYTSRSLFYLVFSGALLVNISWGVEQNVRNAEFFKEDGGSWRLYERVADDVFSDAEGEFGYYIFSPDQFGYSHRYAMHFQQQNYKNRKAYPFEKKKTVYLISTPNDNPTLSYDGWKSGQVKLNKKPVSIKKYRDGFAIEKYSLTPEEVSIPSDPNMIGATLLFR